MTKLRSYIPVAQSYQLPGPTYRLGEAHAGAARFESDDQRAEFLRARTRREGLWSSLSTQARLEARVARWFAAAVRRDEPELVGNAESLDEMAASVQEDVVIMSRESGAAAVTARAAYVNVSFPSGWCPACVCGRSFVSIHAPVPNAGAFDGPGRRAGAELLFGSEDLVRFVWSITPDNRLDRRKCHRADGDAAPHGSVHSRWDSAAELFLRVERQVIAPIDADTSCFLIRIYRYAIAGLPADVRECIYSSIATMPAQVQRYKGIAEARPRILDLLRAT